MGERLVDLHSDRGGAVRHLDDLQEAGATLVHPLDAVVLGAVGRLPAQLDRVRRDHLGDQPDWRFRPDVRLPGDLDGRRRRRHHDQSRDRRDEQGTEQDRSPGQDG
jgi:hypothetical protein